MNIGVEISDRLNQYPRLRIITNDMSTQVFGAWEDVMPAVTGEIRRSFEENSKCVFAMKVLGPFRPGS